jgi:methylated-DNA-[protein]-cysteine S-methyltransferase
MEKSFAEKCYDVLRKVPKGKVTTYGAIAASLGTSACRAVGTAMHKNPYDSVPCHRVVSSGGKIGGFAEGVGVKIEILKKEGVVVKDGKVQNFENIFYRF